MKAVKRATCPACKYNTDTTESKVDANNVSPKLKCPKCGTPLKLSAQWYAKGQSNGQKIFHPCGTFRKDAELYISECLRSKHTGSILPGKEPVLTWEDGKKAFEDAEMKTTTRKFYKSMIASLSKEFQKCNLTDITPDRLNAFAKKRKQAGKSACTIGGEICTIKRMFSLVVENISAKQYPRLHEAWLDIKKVKRPTIDNYKDKFFTPAEIQRLIEHSPDFLALAIRIQIETGLRPGNVYSLKFSDITEDGAIAIAPDNFKNGKAFVTSISAKLLKDLKVYALKNGYRNWLFPSPMPTGGPRPRMDMHWQKACADAGVEGTPHKLRHSFASIMLSQGVPLSTVSVLMGHSDIGITLKRYGHLEQSLKRDVLAEYREKLAL